MRLDFSQSLPRINLITGPLILEGRLIRPFYSCIHPWSLCNASFTRYISEPVNAFLVLPTERRDILHRRSSRTKRGFEGEIQANFF